MDSIQANIFLKVQDRLATGATGLAHIDQDLGQLEFYDKKPPVKFPCGLLDLDDTEYSDAGENMQIADRAVLIVRLGLLAYGDTAHYAPEQFKQLALEYYNLEHRVNKLLHGWCDSQYFSPLARRKAYKEKRDDNLRVRVLRYEFAFRDNTAMAVPASTIVTPGLSVDINQP